MPKNLQGSEICYTFALANEKNGCTRLDSLAQLVEHNTFNVGVLGSSPRRITKERPSVMKAFTFLYISRNCIGDNVRMFNNKNT